LQRSTPHSIAWLWRLTNMFYLCRSMLTSRCALVQKRAFIRPL
jgi:hypothetical protein